MFPFALSLDRPLARGPFLVWGLELLAGKIVLDAGLAAAFGRPFSLAFYVNPFASLVAAPSQSAGHAFPHVSAGPATAYWLTVVGLSLPFLLAGVTLMIRRLRDVGLPPPLALLFFVPFLKFLAFAALAALPSKDPARKLTYDAGPFRSAEIDVTPPPPSSRTVSRRRRRLGLLYGSLSGAGIGMSAMGLSVYGLRDYGAPFMIATPFVAGFVATWVYARLYRPSLRGMLAVTMLSFTIGMIGLGLSAIEGFACMIMASPLFGFEAILGGLLAHAIARSHPVPAPGVTPSALALLPLAFAANAASPAPPEPAAPVESEVVVHAPPDVVWKRVIAFPPLAPPTESIFRAGIAAPLAATIDGEGPGAVRRCEFTTGTFVEPITVWSPGRELSFSVSSQPDPMREATLYPGPRPPHLDGYLESTRGQFVLEPLPDGSTRLVGRTWYRVNMAPVPYWRLWGDRIIHAVHMRVLRHVAALAERDARTLTASADPPTTP
jgi:uncharacterized membrane protein YhaH (DUF805 family)